jgi:hypothetical protein
MIRVLPIVLLVLSGCTPVQWVKQDAAPKQVDEDLVACRQEAWREARLRTSWFRPLSMPYAVQDAQGRRFLVWPHNSVNDTFSDQFMEESRLAHFCMRAKGYELVPVEKEKPATPK